MDLGLEALRVGLARHARVCVERGKPDAEHRAEERGPGRGECRVVGRWWRGQGRDAGERGCGWVCARLGGGFPCVERGEVVPVDVLRRDGVGNNINCIQRLESNLVRTHLTLYTYSLPLLLKLVAQL